MAIADVQAACDVCLAEHKNPPAARRFRQPRKFPPSLPKDAQGTVEEARRLHAAIARKNAMIKVPATDAGIEALETLIADGISVNLTLLFSRAQTLKAYAAYARGIAKRLAARQSVAHIQAVASFFISRVDGALDATLPDHLQGKNRHRPCKAAYKTGRNTSAAPNLPLEAKGANRVQLLWASGRRQKPRLSRHALR